MLGVGPELLRDGALEVREGALPLVEHDDEEAAYGR
jgi:hypothetical protein